MTKLAHSKKLFDRVRATRAFTLIEVLMAASIGAFILAGVLTTYICGMKGLQAISNYVLIHQKGRHAVDVFSRDMQAVSSISSYSKSGSIVVTIPTSFAWNGVVTASNTVTYSYSGSAWSRSDTQSGVTKTLAANVNRVILTLFDRIGNPTTALSTAKSIQVDLHLRKYVMNNVQSEDYVSARIIMRNKP